MQIHEKKLTKDLQHGTKSIFKRGSDMVVQVMQSDINHRKEMFIQDFRNTQNKNTKILEIIHKLYIYTRFIYIYLFTVIKEMFIFMFIFS